MVAVKRISVFVGAIILAGIVASLSSGPAGWQMSEPVTLVLVLGFTAVLGVLTYDPKELGRELSRVFTAPRGVREFDRRVMAQLALYALAAGLVLCIVQILIQQFARGEAVDEAFGAAALRMPLMSLLYGVLTAVGFWAVSGQDLPDSVKQNRAGGLSDKRQVVAAFCVMLLTAGVVSTFVLTMNLMSRGEAEDDEEVIAVKPVPVGLDVPVAGLVEQEAGPRMYLDLDRAVSHGETRMAVVGSATETVVAKPPPVRVEERRAEMVLAERQATPAVSVRRAKPRLESPAVTLRWE